MSASTLRHCYPPCVYSLLSDSEGVGGTWETLKFLIKRWWRQLDYKYCNLYLESKTPTKRMQKIWNCSTLVSRHSAKHCFRTAHSRNSLQNSKHRLFIFQSVWHYCEYFAFPSELLMVGQESTLGVVCGLPRLTTLCQPVTVSHGRHQATQTTKTKQERSRCVGIRS